MPNIKFDYRAIKVLSAIIELKSFELAAQKLHITQSAVSQRLKSLQNYYGDPLLVRAQPYRPTGLGMKLISHFKQIKLLEDSTRTTLSESNVLQTVSIALNHDSLESWFSTLLSSSKQLASSVLDIVTDDEDRVLEYLNNGLSSIVFSSTRAPCCGQVNPYT